MTSCLKPRAGILWPASIAMIPYMRGNLRRKRHALLRAGAVIAVSSTIAADLRERAAGLDPARLHVVPNPVGVEAIETARATSRPLGPPYALYVGKLAPNKGADLLVPAAQAAGLRMPLVVVGDGPSSQEVAAAAATSGLDVRFQGWQPREETLRWTAHATFLVFPSRGPESLSRVLLEAGALGVPAAAMDTGGTRDIVSHEATGLLSPSPDALARDVARLASDPALRERLGRAAASHVRSTFDAAAVVARVESVYAGLVAGRPERERG
jgi:glycosyltransferase involved in cell wall biosynthesis